MGLDRKGWQYAVGEHYGLIWLTALWINHIKSFFCELKDNAKFHNLRTTPFGRKKRKNEEKRERKKEREKTLLTVTT